LQVPGLTRRPSIIGALSLIAVLAATGHLHAEDRVSMRATAGLGGLVKAGRWAPIRVHIDTPGSLLSPDPTAELVARWGDATLRRRVFLGAAGARRFDLYLRTTEASSLVRVSLEGATTIEVPVTVVPFDTRVTLCVGDPDRREIDAARCSITLPANQLPDSARGYEIVDELLAAGPLTGAMRNVLDQWRSLHELESNGDLAVTPQVTRPLVPRGLPAASAAAVGAVAGVYIGLLWLVGTRAVSTRRAASRAWLAYAGTVIVGCVAMWLVGRIGPGTGITVHHTSLVQQLPGTGDALVTSRAVVEFPSEEDVQLSLPAADAVIEPAAASGRAPQFIDPSGYPALLTRAGLGTRQAFTTEALVPLKWLSVQEEGGVVRITNDAPTVLRDCRFADGMSVTLIGELAPGATVAATRHSEVMGPVLTCTSQAAPLPLGSPSRTVHMTGTTTIAVYQRRPARPAPEVSND
jgi:hypothetical protein